MGQPSPCPHITYHQNAQTTVGPPLPSTALGHAAGTRGGTRNPPSPYLLLGTLPPSAAALPAPDSPAPSSGLPPCACCSTTRHVRAQRLPSTFSSLARLLRFRCSFFLPALAPLNSQCLFQKCHSSEGWGSEREVLPRDSLGRQTSQRDEPVYLLPQPQVFRITISDR